MEISFELFISYSQIALFSPNLQNPFNDWQDEHVTQGFAWRPGSVSFRTLEESGTSLISICRENGVHVDNRAIRAILVPFTITESEYCEVASISDKRILKVGTGNYGVLYQTGYSDDGTIWIRFSFIQMQHVVPQVIRADEELSPKEPLLMEASPA